MEELISTHRIPPLSTDPRCPVKWPDSVLHPGFSKQLNSYISCMIIMPSKNLLLAQYLAEEPDEGNGTATAVIPSLSYPCLPAESPDESEEQIKTKQPLSDEDDLISYIDEDLSSLHGTAPQTRFLSLESSFSSFESCSSLASSLSSSSSAYSSCDTSLSLEYAIKDFICDNFRCWITTASDDEDNANNNNNNNDNKDKFVDLPQLVICSHYKMGPQLHGSEFNVFFRAGSLTSLEVARDEKITGTITKFQACCRGYLGRKKLEKLRLQQTAISCIQKNVRKFMLIRDWPWWRLYVRVKPLLNVHKTEEELKNKEAELEQLKVKFEKVEREKNEYKLHCDRLDSRLSELNADLTEEATTTSHASEMLEQETAERMRLEKELKDVQGKYNQTRRQNEKLEREVMQCRLWQATSFDGDAEEDTADESVYKERYEKSRKELHFLKQQLQHQHEEELQQEQNIKRHLEKRYQETTEEREALRQQVGSQKKKCTKLNAEMQDIKRHLDEQTSRNNDLERKQRRFDSELNMSQQECHEERALREKLQREKEELQALKYSLEQGNSKLKMDNELSNEKIERLERELADLSESGGKDDKEYMALKRAKHELAMKVAEQEEELDDQAGQIQQLEQTKLRLEMNLQNLRQQHMKEIEEKDEDLEELRYSTQKKLKQLESQLEEEYDDKRLLMQDKRELERQVQEMMTQGVQNNSDNERKLKKDLRRTKALLRDAEIVIQKQQSTESSKATIRQLRNQLEDAAFTAASAVKAKKNLEIELEELQQQLEEMSKGKQDAEARYMTVLRELTDVQSRTEEAEEDMNEIMAKYKAAVRQQTIDQMTISEHLRHSDELQAENEKLKSEISSLTTKVECVEDQTVSKTQVSRLESKVREVESKLELETSTRHRLESNLARMKEQLEKVMEERDRVAELRHQSEEKQKKLQRQIRDIREEAGDLQKRELETNHKKQELESRLTDLEIDYDQSQSDLKLAFKRISGLQAALEESVETDEDDESYLSYSDEDDFEDDLEDTFLSNHKPVSGVYDSSNERSRSISGTSYEQDAQFGAETLTFNKGSVSEA